MKIWTFLKYLECIWIPQIFFHNMNTTIDTQGSGVTCFENSFAEIFFFGAGKFQSKLILYIIFIDMRN